MTRMSSCSFFGWTLKEPLFIYNLCHVVDDFHVTVQTDTI